MAEKWPRWQADKLMGLALSAVLNRDSCGFGVVHISMSQFHTSFCSPNPVRETQFSSLLTERQRELMIHLCFAERALIINTMFLQVQNIQ